MEAKKYMIIRTICKIFIKILNVSGPLTIDIEDPNEYCVKFASGCNDIHVAELIMPNHSSQVVLVCLLICCILITCRIFGVVSVAISHKLKELLWMSTDEITSISTYLSVMPDWS